MRKKGKKYLKAQEAVPKEPVTLSQAVDKLKSLEGANFDETVECVVRLGIDPRQADQLIRSSVSLPNGIGKSKKVIAFCEDSDIDAAKQAGAAEAGTDELVEKINGGWMDFDVAIASPKVMSKVGRLGKVLGPQGKMPSPKNGTVTGDVVNAVKEFAAGKVEFRNDAGGNVHAIMGKKSFDSASLVGNIKFFIELLKKMRPASTKGTYLKGITLSTTMSPGIAVEISSI